MNIRAKELEVYVTKIRPDVYKIQYRLPNQFFLRTVRDFWIGGITGKLYEDPEEFSYLAAKDRAKDMTIESIQQMERQYAEDKQAKIAAYKKPTNRERIK